MYFDTHAHLDLEAFQDDWQATLHRMREAGVSHHLNILMGPDPLKITQALDTLGGDPGIYFSIGVHPHDAKRMTESSISSLAPFFSHPKVKAVGEIGLDYHYQNSPIAAQQNCFEAWCAFAIEKDLPVVVHSRDAFDDTASILRDLKVAEKVPVVIHCFTGGPDEADRLLKLGCHLSYSGVVTFKNSEANRAAAAITPLNRLLIETDSPYLAPVPHRGKRNEPTFVIEVAKCIAQVKQLPLGEIADQSFENACRVFDIPK